MFNKRNTIRGQSNNTNTISRNNIRFSKLHNKNMDSFHKRKSSPNKGEDKSTNFLDSKTPKGWRCQHNDRDPENMLHISSNKKKENGEKVNKMKH